MESKLKEDRLKLAIDKEYLNKVEKEKMKEFENKIQKKIENKKILEDQLEQIKIFEDRKKNLKLNDLEEDKKYRDKFQSLMDTKDQERLDYKLNIQEKAKIRDLREKMHMNQRSLQEMIDNEIESKYKKEKELIEFK